MKLETLLDMVRRSKYPDMLVYNYLGTGDQYVIDQCHGGWQVFYYERGIKLNTHFFNELELACDYAYDQIKNNISEQTE